MGYTIINIVFYEGVQATDVGFFGSIGTTGVVRNLGLLNLSGYVFFQPIGGIAGENAGLITHSYTTGYFDAEAESGAVAGGIAGQNDGTIERSWSSANVGSAGLGGGIAGINTGVIVQSYATGVVGGGSLSASGGLVGQNTSTGVINQSYATGAVDATVAGGIAGQNMGLIEQSFSTSALTYSFEIAGGVVNSNEGVIASNVFWDVDTTGRTNGVGSGTPIPAANGLTTAQMSVAASFGPTWDFTPATGTWAIPAGDTHPVLQWQLDP